MSQNYQFTGKVGKTPLLRHSAKGTSYCFFDVCVKGESGKKPLWWHCVAYGGLAEDVAAQYTGGDSISISESYFIPTIDNRNGAPTLQVKVQKLGRLTRDGVIEQAPDYPEPAPPSDYQDDEVPF